MGDKVKEGERSLEEAVKAATVLVVGDVRSSHAIFGDGSAKGWLGGDGIMRSRYCLGGKWNQLMTKSRGMRGSAEYLSYK